MKQDKWARQLHDKLAEHEMTAPEGLWTDIEAALQQAETLQKSAKAPQKARFIFMRRWIPESDSYIINLYCIGLQSPDHIYIRII